MVLFAGSADLGRSMGLGDAFQRWTAPVARSSPSLDGVLPPRLGRMTVM
jgi:hypothetical protein